MCQSNACAVALILAEVIAEPLESRERLGRDGKRVEPFVVGTDIVGYTHHYRLALVGRFEHGFEVYLQSVDRDIEGRHHGWLSGGGLLPEQASVAVLNNVGVVIPAGGHDSVGILVEILRVGHRHNAAARGHGQVAPNRIGVTHGAHTHTVLSGRSQSCDGGVRGGHSGRGGVAHTGGILDNPKVGCAFAIPSKRNTRRIANHLAHHWWQAAISLALRNKTHIGGITGSRNAKQ